MELYHVNYVNHGTWTEELLDFRSYKDLGLSLGSEVRYKFYRSFSLGLEINFTHYFTEVSPNQLSNAIFIGYLL